jgi:hypothetical protein
MKIFRTLRPYQNVLNNLRHCQFSKLNRELIPKLNVSEKKNNFGLMYEGTIISKLSNRSMISVQGPDATAFL